jgi:hypothetical protein
LSSPDVTAAIGHIRDHTATAYRPLPAGPDSTSGTAHLAAGSIETLLLVPPGADRTVDLVLPESAQPTIDAETLYGDILLINQAALDLANAAAHTLDPSSPPIDLTPSGPAAPDTWRFHVPADEWAVVRVGTAANTAADVPFSATTPIRTYVDQDGNQPIAIGGRVLGAIDTLETNDTYLIDLAAGQHVSISASSPQGDVLFGVVAPGQKVTDGAFTDDSGLGLYGVDAHTIYTAPAAGTYRIVVATNDYVATGYALEVTAA